MALSRVTFKSLCSNLSKGIKESDFNQIFNGWNIQKSEVTITTQIVLTLKRCIKLWCLLFFFFWMRNKFCLIFCFFFVVHNVYIQIFIVAKLIDIFLYVYFVLILDIQSFFYGDIFPHYKTYMYLNLNGIYIHVYNNIYWYHFFVELRDTVTCKHSYGIIMNHCIAREKCFSYLLQYKYVLNLAIRPLEKE